jgi:glyoxylase-like metal-dependent hydrolase (beta-lactamase superfamily II)
VYFKQFYLGCLAHASYLIGDGGEAAVVDPQRDVDQYLEEARAQGLVIRHVIETHLHADFVSGHLELARRTGARIYFGHRAGVAFDHVPVREGDEVRIGRLRLRFLETPGHTPESISVLVFEPGAAAPARVLTGDTLFVGDVGRPDLVGSKGYSADQMAGMLYDSLHGKLLALPDPVEVYPAHGAGSACGRNISSETVSTVGRERRMNYALQPMSKAEFVRMATADLPPAPQYFPHDAEANRVGAPALGELRAPEALAPEAVAIRTNAGAVVLDVRAGAAFGRGHLPGSVNIGLAGQFAPWAGTLLDLARPVILVADGEAEVREAAMRLARVGLERVEGYLDGGVAAWDAAGLPIDGVEPVRVDELRRTLDAGEPVQLVDVRRPGEYASGHIPGAINVPLDQLEVGLGRLDRGRRVVAVCESGYRSSAASSVLKRHGFDHVLDAVGGTRAWTGTGHPVASGEHPGNLRDLQLAASSGTEVG